MTNILMKGIDISACQTNIDFKALKSGGYDFVIIRAGYGKYAKQKDTMFEDHYKKAKEAELHIGCYWYSYAVSEQEAKQEADVFYSIIKGKQFDMPVYYDIEEQSTFAQGASAVDKIANVFCQAMEKYGYFCGIYGGQHLGDNLLSKNTRSRYAFWLAQYLKTPSYTGQYGMWQFGIAGDVIGNNPAGITSVPGVVGKVDMDYCYVDYPTQIKKKKLNGYQDQDIIVDAPTVDNNTNNTDSNNFTFVPRFKIPEDGNPYYNTISNGGYSTAIVGSPTHPKLNVLSNCCGFSLGRFNEIIGENNCNHLTPINAEDWVDMARSQGYTISNTPSLGAVICWAKGRTHDTSDGAGHVAVVEQINSDGTIITSESGWGCTTPFWIQTRSNTNGNWGQDKSYTFLGFIVNPKVNPQPQKENRAPYKVPTIVVKEDQTGDNVKWLQWYLTDLKYYEGTIDGVFDTFTLGALLAFQFKNGLELDGCCGPATRQALINA